MDLKLFVFDVLVAAAFIVFGRLVKARSEHVKVNVIRVIAVVTILADFSIVPYRVFTDYAFRLNQDLSTDLPMMFCDIMMLIELATFCGPRVVRFLVPFGVWGSGLSGIFVLVDPTFYDPHTFFFDFTQFRSILTHSLLLTIFVFAVASGYFRIRLKYMWNVLLCFVGMMVYALVLNAIYAHSVLAAADPGFVLNALYMQQSPISIKLAVGPIIAVFLFCLLFLVSFLVELGTKRDPGSVFAYYAAHPGHFWRTTAGYFIRDRGATPDSFTARP